MTDTQHDSLAARRFSRRTIAKGAVWSVPVIASVALAPQAAASATATVSIISSCTANSFTVTVTSGTLNVGTTFLISVTGLSLNSSNVVVNPMGVFTGRSSNSAGITISNPIAVAPTGSTFTVRITPPSVAGLVTYSISGPTGDGVMRAASLSYTTAGVTVCSFVSAT